MLQKIYRQKYYKSRPGKHADTYDNAYYGGGICLITVEGYHKPYYQSN